jgi:tetratricopeptide (TPR) repeat protein
LAAALYAAGVKPALPRSAMRATAALIAALLGALLLPTACFSGRNIARDHQLREASRLTPAPLDSRKRWEGEPRKGKVRVYTDEAYRGQAVRWKKRFVDELDYANQYLIPVFGLELEVVDWREWDRKVDAAHVFGAVAELAAVDPGDDVDWVIGLTTALPIADASLENLGAANLLGKHLVLRGYNDLAEFKLFPEVFDELAEAERVRLMDARRRHKQTVVILHELGHTLGAIHETDPGWLMHPSYDPRMATVSDKNRDIMMRAIEHRLKPKEQRDDLAFFRELLNLVEGDDFGGWVASDRDDLVAFLREHIEVDRATEVASPIPQEVRAQYAAIAALIQKRDLARARSELAPLVQAYPGNAAIRMLDCQLSIVVEGPGAAATTATCGRAADLAPGDPGVYLLLGAAHAGKGDMKAARQVLDQAAARIANLPDGTKAWMQLAGLYQQLNSITWAEEAAAKAGDGGAAVATWGRGLRNRYGLPRDAAKFGVTPDKEADYLRDVRGLLDLVYASKFPEARALAAEADRRWPKAPGIAAARCDLALREKQYGAAKGHCKRALSAFPDDSWASYLLGILASRDGDQRGAAASLKRAIEADPDLGQAYRALAKVYGKTKDTAALEALRASYAGHFGSALPE